MDNYYDAISLQEKIAPLFRAMDTGDFKELGDAFKNLRESINEKLESFQDPNSPLFYDKKDVRLFTQHLCELDDLIHALGRLSSPLDPPNKPKETSKTYKTSPKTAVSPLYGSFAKS
jgi:hypothetical protein